MQHVHDAVYMAHGYCLLWLPWLVNMHVFADGAIFVAYTAIPAAILTFLHRRQFPTPSFNHLGYWFAAFIFLCGLTHIIQILTMWVPWYEFQGYLKLLTGFVSLFTAVIIWILIPKALTIPTRTDWEDLLHKLEDKNNELEKLVEERTMHLNHLMQESAHRSRNLLTVVQGILSMSARDDHDIDTFTREFNGRLVCLSTVFDMLVANQWTSASIHDVVRKQLEPFGLLNNLRISGPGISLNPTQAQYLSLALYELATNATKFELKVGVGSRYTLEWAVREGMFKLSWHEENARVIEKPTRQGFGHRLLKRIVPDAFNKGNAHLLFGTHTVDYILEAKL